MRLYSFTNMYTSGIHAGIQTAHVIHEMMRKYTKKSTEVMIKGEPGLFDGSHPTIAKYNTMNEWADKHKTIIVKNGGYHSHLVSLYDELKEYSAHFNLPMCRWRESKEALNNAQTAVCIVVPAEIYSFTGEGVTQAFPEPIFASKDAKMKFELNNILNRYRFAS